MEGARLATADDLGRLSELLGLAIEATPDLRGGHLFGRPARDRDVRARLRAALDDRAQLLLCGLVDDYTVGFALISIEDTTGVIEEIFVEPDARAVGVGEALLDTAVEWCRDQNCTGVDMPALPGDRATKNLAERTGFSARAIWMHRRL